MLPNPFIFSARDFETFTSIKNVFGKFHYIFQTYIAPCVSLRGEVDLNTILMEEIWMEITNKFLKQKLDYKDVAFRHISCFARENLIPFCFMYFVHMERISKISMQGGESRKQKNRRATLWQGVKEHHHLGELIDSSRGLYVYFKDLK